LIEEQRKVTSSKLRINLKNTVEIEAGVVHGETLKKYIAKPPKNKFETKFY
jgi:hypothetical protein